MSRCCPNNDLEACEKNTAQLTHFFNTLDEIPFFWLPSAGSPNYGPRAEAILSGAWSPFVNDEKI